MKKNAYYKASVFAVCLLFAACDSDIPSASYGENNILSEDSLYIHTKDSSKVQSDKDFFSHSKSSSSRLFRHSSSSTSFWEVSSSSQNEHFSSAASSSNGFFAPPSSSSHANFYPWGWHSSQQQFYSSFQVSSSSANNSLSTECVNIRGTSDKFHQITDVINCVLPNEKVAYVIRHAERNKSSTGTEGRLNSNGRKQSLEFGKKLSQMKDIYFMHTKVYRTMETVLKITEGKGQSFSETDIPFKQTIAEDHEQSADILDSYFIKDENKFNDCKGQHSWSWSAYSYFAYEEKVSRECLQGFYDVDDRIDELIKNNFSYGKMHDITMAISHDQFLVPFIISVSNRKNIDLRFHNHENEESRYDYWINYLTGVAIIINEKDERVIIPVTAMEDPYLRVFPEN